MSKHIFQGSILFLTVLLFWGCEKTISFDLEEQEPRLVVEATIENGQPPRVFLTRSLNYFSQIRPELLAGSFVHDASVFVSNGARTHQLKEYALPVTSDYTIYYYSIDSSSPGTAFLGELGSTYSLRIEDGSGSYTAATTIPRLNKRVDSIWWVPTLPPGDSGEVLVYVRATDPPGFGDYVRYFTKRNSEPFLPPINSAFDDLFIDGTTYELAVEPGFDRNTAGIDEERFFRRGDTITFKLSSIDKATYDFWRTMDFSFGSVGNPFSSPTRVLSNISGGALGYFGGYGTQYHTIIIPR